MTVQQNPQPGWYDDGSGHQRWWDGQAWGPHAPQAAVQPVVQVMHAPPARVANNMPVAYQRQQTGHSITKWILLSVIIIGIPGLIYYSASPNHYWHA